MLSPLCASLHITHAPRSPLTAHADARARRRAHAAINHIPGASAEKDLKPDTMHIFMNGLSRHEGFYMMDDVTTNTPVTWDDINTARKAMNKDLPPGHRIPELIQPAKNDGKSTASMHLTLSASDMLHFIVNRCVSELASV